MGSSSSTVNKPTSRPERLGFHRLHGENVQVSRDWQSVVRLRDFDGAVCFSNKPLPLNRYVDLRIDDVDPSWRGVLRIGVTSMHPGMMTRKDVPPLACPDLEQRDGFWVRAVPETMATLGTSMYFYVTDKGDIMCGTTLKDKRQAFEEEMILSGVSTRSELWMVLDLYGQTKKVELFEPKETLWVMHHKPDKQTSNKERLAKLVDRGTEDPNVENSINEAIRKQRERGEEPSASGSGTDPLVAASAGGDTQETGNALPAVASPATQEQVATAHEGDTEGAPITAPPSECTMCLDAVANCALYKCGHVCLCHACATNLKNQPEALCPICREPVEDVIKTFQP